MIFVFNLQVQCLQKDPGEAQQATMLWVEKYESFDFAPTQTHNHTSITTETVSSLVYYVPDNSK